MTLAPHQHAAGLRVRLRLDIMSGAVRVAAIVVGATFSVGQTPFSLQEVDPGNAG
eukprot:gene7932-7344_t